MRIFCLQSFLYILVLILKAITSYYILRNVNYDRMIRKSKGLDRIIFNVFAFINRSTVFLSVSMHDCNRVNGGFQTSCVTASDCKRFMYRK